MKRHAQSVHTADVDTPRKQKTAPLHARRLARRLSPADQVQLPEACLPPTEICEMRLRIAAYELATNKGQGSH